MTEKASCQDSREGQSSPEKTAASRMQCQDWAILALALPGNHTLPNKGTSMTHWVRSDTMKAAKDTALLEMKLQERGAVSQAAGERPVSPTHVSESRRMTWSGLSCGLPVAWDRDWSQG